MSNEKPKVNVASMSSTKLYFLWGLSASDPEEKPVLIVGQVKHLNGLTWKDIKSKLEPRVSEEIWHRGLSCVTKAPGESTELYPRGAVLATLPERRSRHAAPARPHALAKIVKSTQREGQDGSIVLVCRKREVYASAMAIARSFPLYSARGDPPGEGSTVNVEILLVPEVKQKKDQEEEEEEEGCGRVTGVLLQNTLAEEELSCIQNAADCVRLAARLTDTPANIMNVDQFILEACRVAKRLDIPPPTVIRGKKLLARGMGGIYGVGKAASCPPALVSLTYVPGGGEDKGGVAWVGKGIVYDTGGLSMKSKTSMVGMKGDCGGAAAVLAAFKAAVLAKPTVTLHAVLCLAENSVGPNATRPDDIHTLYSGRTVEINNTDAEGRLVLGDGVVYASRDLQASVIVDVATLTGAQGIATGKYHAAIVTNDAAMEQKCVRSGVLSGDLAHALPFAPELHFSELGSQLADMKNSVADRGNAQVSCAALFVLAQLGLAHAGPWLHVDMAAPAHCGERATGYGVGLLTTLFGFHTRSALLRALSPGPVLNT